MALPEPFNYAINRLRDASNQLRDAIDALERSHRYAMDPRNKRQDATAQTTNATNRLQNPSQVSGDANVNGSST